MAWGGSGWYADTFKLALAQDIALDLELTTHKIGLYTNSLTPDFSASAPGYSATNEVSGAGYTAGGKAVTGTTLTVSSGILVWDSDNVSWTTSTLSGVHGGIIYADVLTGNNLILGIDFTTDYATADGTLLITVHANGLGRVDYVP